MTLDEILKEIKVAQNIVILTHESPDGDAIGSSLAMRLMLKELEKECDVIIPEYSRLFDFLPGIETIKKESEIKNYDLAIAVDCADIKRIAKKEYFENAKNLNEVYTEYDNEEFNQFDENGVIEEHIPINLNNDKCIIFMPAIYTPKDQNGEGESAIFLGYNSFFN